MAYRKSLNHFCSDSNVQSKLIFTTLVKGRKLVDAPAFIRVHKQLQIRYRARNDNST